MRAVDKYDYKRGNRFSTTRHGGSVRPSPAPLPRNPHHPHPAAHDRAHAARCIARRSRLSRCLGLRPTPKKSPPKWMCARYHPRHDGRSQHAVALERPVGEDGGPIRDFIEDRKPSARRRRDPAPAGRDIEQVPGRAHQPSFEHSPPRSASAAANRTPWKRSPTIRSQP